MRLAARVFPPLVLAAAIFALYRGVVNYPFQFDDLAGIVDNQAILDLWNLSEIWWHNPSRFIMFLSFALNYHLGGLNTYSYHILSIAFHAAATLVYYYFLRLLFRANDRLEGKNVDPLLTGACVLTAALIFAIHPLNTQAVTYIWQRGTSIATLFYIASLAAYLKSASDELGGLSPARWKGWLIFSVLLAFLSMISKQFSVTIPVAVALMEFIVISGSLKEMRKRLARVLVFAPMLLLVPLLTMLLGKGEVADLGERAANLLPAHQYLMTEFNVIVFVYLKLLFYPVNQNLDYDFPPALSMADCAVAFMVLAALFAAGVLLRRRNRIASFGIIFAFLAASVESSFFVLEDLVFEHRMYLPMTALLAALVSLERQALGKIGSPRGAFVIATLISIAISIPLYAIAAKRNLVWRDSLSLWEDVVAKSPNKIRGLNNLASILIWKKQEDRALELLYRGRKIDPGYYLTYYNLGRIHEARKDFPLAVQNYLESIKLNPQSYETAYRLGSLFLNLTDYDRAIKYYIMAVNSKPRDNVARMDLGVALGASGRYDQAIKVFEGLVRMDPANGQAHYNLAMAYRYKGDSNKAEKHLKNAENLGYR
ncbi:MAG: tetratricopeptide repeat protein [Nitrospinota bacterium]|nr:tetratricopeptide repeat protein [Nitrospinota bacterium]